MKINTNLNMKFLSVLGLLAASALMFFNFPPVLLSNYLTSGSTTCSSEHSVNSQAELNFEIHDGKIYNKFFRDKEVAAHTLLTSGNVPRLIVAFPAGNSGVSLWFKESKQPIEWQEIEKIKGITQTNQDGEILFGIEAELKTTAKELVVEQAVLSSIRLIRDFSNSNFVPKEIVNQELLDGDSFTWYRDRLDGSGGYKLGVNVLQGSVSGGQGQPVVFKAPETGDLTIQIQALTGDTPLTPIIESELLHNAEEVNSLAKNILAFLSYEEKMLAGSWRFATYFGRDTLMSIRLLMPSLTPETIEAALGSVIERLSVDGEIAHEEYVGEYAILRQIHESERALLKPIYDYKMIDDNYMLAPIIAHYLLGTTTSKSRAKVFLQQKTTDGKLFGKRLIDNFNFVIDTTTPYADSQVIENLIKLQEGSSVGEWRDSPEGLGNGRYPYNVNAILVPAALKAISELYQSGLLDDYIDRESVVNQNKAQANYNVWREHAQLHFRVSIKQKEATTSVMSYSERNRIGHNFDMDYIVDSEYVSFNGVALDEHGVTIPVLNSDEGFALLFSKPDEKELIHTVQTSLKPFPIGLITPVGMVVANPAYASEKIQKLFSNAHYHGAVIWSWQQALYAAGLQRQLLRDDLSDETKKLLKEGQCKLWKVINNTKDSRNSELWSWSINDGEFKFEPFGQRSGDKTESNAAQLWSTVYLALAAPECS